MLRILLGPARSGGQVTCYLRLFGSRFFFPRKIHFYVRPYSRVWAGEINYFEVLINDLRYVRTSVCLLYTSPSPRDRG